MVILVDTAIIRDAVARVVDPEIPSLTIEDLGILRDVQVDDGRVVVTITPTYAGCPAMDVICSDVVAAARDAGAAAVEVRTVLAPAWSTDDITAAGHAKLVAAGIAPPSPVRPSGPVLVRLSTRVCCPNCGSAETEELSRFGSTACKSLRRCTACGEPFDHVKAL